MFEREIQKSGFAKPPIDGGLQPLEWHALAAKLPAAGDLRIALSGRLCAASGNFAHFTLGESAVVNENRLSVNPDALADGKCPGGNVISAANGDEPIADSEMTLGDREL